MHCCLRVIRDCGSVDFAVCVHLAVLMKQANLINKTIIFPFAADKSLRAVFLGVG